LLSIQNKRIIIAFGKSKSKYHNCLNHFKSLNPKPILATAKEKERRKRRGGWFYPLKQRVFEALAPGTVPGHPAPTGLAASACPMVCATVTNTTPNIASAATTAITAS
jgi:hypothetical protein